MVNPDLKEVLDSVGDGVAEVLMTAGRISERSGTAIHTYGVSLKSIGDEVKAQMPDNPIVLLTSAVRTAGATVRLMVDGADAVVGSAHETITGVKSQIERIVGR